ncbi:MAG: homocysteine S-methyltransferase family protein [Oscillospiraceae bacterium]|nr:homocysteine S-methyltransferase family protein [Oscillospiraceae bacterium]
MLILDGAMGTMLQAAGLPAGQLPELWNLTHPETVAAIHRRYVEAGSRVLYTNTFGANRLKTAGCGHSPAELVTGAVRCAREAAAGHDVKVALDIGPIGRLLEPLGDLSFDEAYDLFKELIVAGENAGADLVVIETMSDLYEVKAAVLAARENSRLPVWVTMTFEATGRSFLGVTVSSMALTLTGLGVDALGFNCSLGPQELMPLVRELREWTDLPIILKPNAGLPDPATGEYGITPAEFAAAMEEAPDLGVSMIGGCCGTTPDFIRALREDFEGRAPAVPGLPKRSGVCSSVNTAESCGVRVIGERINPTGKKRFQQALREHDLDYIVRQAIEQQDAGADILDVNVGLPGMDEAALMRDVVRAVQEAVDLPLQIDSSDPAAIEAGLRVYNGKAIVNSVNGKKEVLDSILPLCKKYGAAVVGLCMDENGIPPDWQGRVNIARRIMDAALACGIPKSDILIDCLTLTVSVQQDQAVQTLQALRYIKEKLGLQTVLGVSNISFGLPSRETITACFLSQALSMGLDLPIINPNQRTVMDTVAAYRVLSGQDRDSEAYIRRFADAPAAPTAEKRGAAGLSDTVMRGLGRETAALTEAALSDMDELEVVNRLLIPALDRVGERYEKQEIFLPQLIKAAGAACEGFEIIKKRIAQRGGQSVSKGKIVLATVQGDIHDIGKNIVRVVLENYGYTVLDLGRDVPPEKIVEAAVREKVKLVGLSALMTTTVPSMAKTIEALRQSGHPCKIMVGGAVLTPEYADEIGADYYAKDAKQSADIAKEVLG